MSVKHWDQYLYGEYLHHRDPILGDGILNGLKTLETELDIVEVTGGGELLGDAAGDQGGETLGLDWGQEHGDTGQWLHNGFKCLKNTTRWFESVVY